jgi:hypothetical protein
MAYSTSGMVHPLVSAVVRDALTAAGERVPAPASSGPTSRHDQRLLLDRLLTVGEGDAVLQAGRHLDRLLDHPLALVLLNSDSVPVLLGKLERLNRYWAGRADAAGWAGVSPHDPEANTAVGAWLLANGGTSHWSCRAPHP